MQLLGTVEQVRVAQVRVEQVRVGQARGATAEGDQAGGDQAGVDQAGGDQAGTVPGQDAPPRTGRAAAQHARVRAPEPRYDWLPAGPFRAHVRHVSVITGTPWPVLAVLARVSLPAVRSLVVGRPGRGADAVRRVCPDVAARLFGLTSMRVRQAATRPVPALRAVVMLQDLTAEVNLPELAHRLGLRRDQLEALLVEPPPATCPELVAASVEAAYRLAWARRGCPSAVPADSRAQPQAA